MRLTFKHRTPTNQSGLTIAWSICYSTAAEMELNKPKKYKQAITRVSTTDFNKVSKGNVQLSCDRRSVGVGFYVIIIEE